MLGKRKHIDETSETSPDGKKARQDDVDPGPHSLHLMDIQHVEEKKPAEQLLQTSWDIFNSWSVDHLIELICYSTDTDIVNNHNNICNKVAFDHLRKESESISVTNVLPILTPDEIKQFHASPNMHTATLKMYLIKFSENISFPDDELKGILFGMFCNMRSYVAYTQDLLVQNNYLHVALVSLLLSSKLHSDHYGFTTKNLLEYLSINVTSETLKVTNSLERLFCKAIYISSDFNSLTQQLNQLIAAHEQFTLPTALFASPALPELDMPLEQDEKLSSAGDSTSLIFAALPLPALSLKYAPNSPSFPLELADLSKCPSPILERANLAERDFGSVDPQFPDIPESNSHSLAMPKSESPSRRSDPLLKA
jgi:hypothetical protein